MQHGKYADRGIFGPWCHRVECPKFWPFQTFAVINAAGTGTLNPTSELCDASTIVAIVERIASAVLLGWAARNMATRTVASDKILKS